MKTLGNIVCPGCTCLCDDLQIATDSKSLTIVNGCEKSQNWFASATASNQSFANQGPVEFDTAITEAAKAIIASKSTLVCALDTLTTAAQQSVWQLASNIGATIDTTLSNSHRAGSFSLQRTGKVTATLGEVAQRSDLIVFWYCDPVTTHPRLLDRSKRNRATNPPLMIVIGSNESATSSVADQTIRLQPQHAAAAVSVLRAIITDKTFDTSRVLAATGQPLEVWQVLADQLIAARYGVCFSGHTTHESTFDLVTDSLAGFVRELNQRTRFISISLRSDANVQSAENVLAWSGGFPMAVNLSATHPRSHWLEYSAHSMLSRRECDLLILGSTGQLAETLSLLDPAAREHFNRVPKIVFAETQSASLGNNVIAQFTVAQPGRTIGGDYCRMDDVSLGLQPIESNDSMITVEYVIAKLRDQLTSSCNALP